jgi:TonB family protein
MANYTILLIDYEPRSIERFRQPLTDAGYTVEVATDGLTGIEAFHRLNPDMVLVEAMIPKKHGFEVCQELKRTPHGRKTPVLITTGVYKGRKYRTQALHIYGCDEYIEKPIAPEQLLGVVGKFFGPGAVTAAAETRPAAPAQSVIAAADSVARTSAPASVTHETAAAPPVRPKSNSGSVVKDFTEEEIMARLDAILPGDVMMPSAVPSQTATMPSSPEPMMIAPAPVEPAASAPLGDFHEIPEMEVDSGDPFAQMQAELTAELGSISAALALEPAPVFDAAPALIPSDQVMAPSVFEALPSPEMEPATIPLSKEPAEAEPEMPGQLVTFDAKRSKRNKKVGKKNPARTEQPGDEAIPAPNALRPTKSAFTASTIDATKDIQPLTLPPGTLAASDLGEVAPKKKIPVWVWAALAAAIAIAVYFIAFHDGSSGGQQVAGPSESTGRVARRAPSPVEQPPARSTTADTSSLVLNSVDAGALLTAPSTSAPAPAPAPAKPSPTLADNTKPTVPSTAPAATARVPATKVTPSPRAPVVKTLLGSVKPTVPESAPASAVDEGAGMAGVESIAAIPAAAVPTIAPGTLVDAAEVDTPPVSLSRKLPIYSLQARQMRLQGTVVMRVLVNERGTVDEVVLVEGVNGADLNNSAMRAARSWTYRPAMKDGVPVKVWKNEQIAFKI